LNKKQKEKTMKTRLLTLALILLSFTSFAQQKDHLYSFGDAKLGAYFSATGKHTSFKSEPAGFLDLKLAVTLNSKWAFGISASGLYYDKQLSDLVSDGTYHAYAGYTSIFVERIFSVNEDFKVSLSIASGAGEAYYQYDKEYRKEKLWTEEIIDKTTFSVLEPGLEIQHRISGNFWIGLSGSYRSTSPVRLLDASENMLRKFSGGLTFKWGVF
jgi:hypothetical protein